MGLAASRPEFYKDPIKAAEHYAQMMNTPGAGRPELVPRSHAARFLQYPWGLAWRRVPAARYIVLSFTITLFVYKKIDDLVNGEANSRTWTKLRKTWEKDIKSHASWREDHRPVWPEED